MHRADLSILRSLVTVGTELVAEFQADLAQVLNEVSRGKTISTSYDLCGLAMAKELQ
jgi:hypothetical protein